MMYRSEMYRSWIKSLVFGSLGLTCSLMADVSLAQNQNAEQVFGQAVHQYFSGQYQETVDDLSLALEAGIEDPRLYYYRGLSKLQMGDEPAAEADFMMGAEIETKYAGRRNFNIGRSLMRVQGATRMMIENARAEARVRTIELQNQSRPVNRRQAMNLLQQRASNSNDMTGTESIPSVRPNLPDLSGVIDPTAPFGSGDSGSGSIPLPPPRQDEQDASGTAGGDPFSQPADEGDSTDASFDFPENTQPTDDPFEAPGNGATGDDQPAADDPFAIPANEPEMEEAANDPFAEPADNPFSNTVDEPAVEPTTTDPFAEATEAATEPTPATDPFAAALTEEPTSDASGSSAIPDNVRSGRVLSGFFSALSAPVRKAANAGANAVQNLQPGGLPGQPGQPPAGFDGPNGFGEQPFGNEPPAGDDPFGNNGTDNDPFK